MDFPFFLKLHHVGVHFPPENGSFGQDERLPVLLDLLCKRSLDIDSRESRVVLNGRNILNNYSDEIEHRIIAG